MNSTKIRTGRFCRTATVEILEMSESVQNKIMELIWYFFAGSFAFNAVPHFVKGVTGQTHMTPFKRVSSPVLNIVWSFVNVVVAFYLLGMASGSGGFTVPWEAGLEGTNLGVFLAGGFATACYLAYFWSNPKARLPWQKD